MVTSLTVKKRKKGTGLIAAKRNYGKKGEPCTKSAEANREGGKKLHITGTTKKI